MDEMTAQAAENHGDDGRRARATWAVVALVLLVIIVLVLLLLPRYWPDFSTGTSGERKIVAVPESPAQPGVVSVWIDESRTIDNVLGGAGIANGEVVDLGGGRYVVGVPAGDERETVARLRELGGVHDAGFVYEEE